MRNFFLIMLVISILLLFLRIYFIDYSNLISWSNVLDLLVPSLLVYIFYSGFKREQNKEEQKED